MPKFAVKGAEEYAQKLSSLGQKSEETAKKAIYAAAAIVADQIKDNMKGLSSVDDKYNMRAYKSRGKSKLTKAQKAGMINSFGITKLQKDGTGFYNVKLGFDGYNDVRTRKYPKGQPNSLIARVAESGSSYMDKTPFIRPAVNVSRRAAQAKMQEVIEEECKKMME